MYLYIDNAIDNGNIEKKKKKRKKKLEKNLIN